MREAGVGNSSSSNSSSRVFGSNLPDSTNTDSEFMLRRSGVPACLLTCLLAHLQV